MQEKLKAIREEALKAIEQADMPEKLNDVRVKFLGKKGELTAVLKSMKDVAKEDRPKVGQLVNEAREEIETALNNAKTAMEKAIREAKLKEEVIDVTLPSKKNMVGHRHPNTIALEEVERISFSVAVDHLRCQFIIFFKENRKILFLQCIFIGRLCDNRLNRNLLESQICQMQYILGKIGVEMGIGSADIVTFLIPAFCKFLEFRNNQVVASRSFSERTHTVVYFFSSINT